MANVSPAAALTHPKILQDDSLDSTLAALSTLSLLNLRLSRLEHLLTGHAALIADNDTNNAASDPSSSTSTNTHLQPTSQPKLDRPTIPSRLHALEIRLSELKSIDGLPGSLVRMVDTLRREFPDIFTSTSSTSVSASTTSPTSQTSTSTPNLHVILSQQATTVLAHASLYTSTSSRLQTLQTLRIPDATVSARIMAQGGRVRSLQQRQEMLEERAAELKRRSVVALEWWVNIGIKSMGELWEDWEDRVAVCERYVGWYERREKERRGEETEKEEAV